MNKEEAKYFIKNVWHFAIVMLVLIWSYVLASILIPQYPQLQGGVLVSIGVVVLVRYIQVLFIDLEIID